MARQDSLIFIVFVPVTPDETGQVAGQTGVLQWHLAFDSRDNLIVVQTQGPIDDKSMPSMLKATNTFAARHQCHRILGDHRSSELMMSTLKLYDSPTTLDGIEADRKNRAALVYASLTELHRFMETVFRNQGRMVALFTDLESARHWLRNP